MNPNEGILAQVADSIKGKLPDIADPELKLGYPSSGYETGQYRRRNNTVKPLGKT